MESPVTDLVIRVKNGYLAGKDQVVCGYSKFKEKIVEKLKELKYVKDYRIEEERGLKKIIVDLLYINKEPALTDVKIFSKPGRRYYVSYKDIKPVMTGQGHSILSTSQGVITNNEALAKKVGGELLFEIW
ncbi:MAG: 30S ribosomal protein S8 [Patescibacteria group bacterium]|nr:30S ribosomal protein S8 [Patescibacteria group bacterium]